MQTTTDPSVSEPNGGRRPLHVFDLQPHLLQKIVDFLDEDDIPALQATSTQWYWHVHQSKIHQSTGDAARLGLLRYSPPHDKQISWEPDCPLYILTRRESVDANDSRASFMTKCYLLSILRSEEPIKISYDERQRDWLSDFADLLVQTNATQTKMTTIVFLIQKFSTAKDIVSCLTDAVAKRPAVCNIIFSAEPREWTTDDRVESEHELHDYSQVANELRLGSELSLSAFSKLCNDHSTSFSSPLYKLMFKDSRHLKSTFDSTSRLPHAIFPLLSHLRIDFLLPSDFHHFQALFQDHLQQIQDLDIGLDDFESIDHLPLEAMRGLQRLTLRDLYFNSSALFEDISKLRQLKVLVLDLQCSSEFCTLSFSDMPSLKEFRLKQAAPCEQESLQRLNSLHNLSILDLSKNDLSLLTSLPFTELTSLESLDLSYCRLEDENILTGLRYLHNLRALDLHNTDLRMVEVLPFQSLAFLQILDISHCDLDGADVLKGLQDLTNLQSLDISHNRLGLLKQLPFGKLEKLEKLTMVDCELHGQHILDSLRALKSLRKLLLSDNALDLVERLPLQNMSRLQELNLDRCTLQGKTVLDELENLRRLKTVSLKENDLSSLVRLPFSSSLSLRKLDLRKCQLQGESILDGLSELRSLQTLDLSNNNFMAVTTLPFGNMLRLRELNISRCRLTGENILDNLRALRHLSSLNLSHNDLQSVNRLQFDDPGSLRRLDLSDTGLSGKYVLQGLEDAIQLRHLTLQESDLSLVETFPFQKWTRLEELRLDNCKLDGNSFVKSLPSLTSCKQLGLSGNDLSSITAISLSHIKNLRKVDLDHCGLLVNILDLSNLPKLKNCSMAHNEITDLRSFPISRSSHPKLRKLDLTGNPVAHDEDLICSRKQHQLIADRVIVLDEEDGYMDYGYMDYGRRGNPSSSE